MNSLIFTNVFAYESIHESDTDRVNYFVKIGTNWCACIAAKLEDSSYESKDCYAYPFAPPYWEEDVVLRPITVAEQKALRTLEYTVQQVIWLTHL